MVRVPQAIFVGVLVVVIGLLGLLGLPWWAAGLATAGGALMQGLFERYIREAAKRRFRSRPEPAALAEVDAGDEHSPTDLS